MIIFSFILIDQVFEETIIFMKVDLNYGYPSLSKQKDTNKLFLFWTKTVEIFAILVFDGLWSI